MRWPDGAAARSFTVGSHPAATTALFAVPIGAQATPKVGFRADYLTQLADVEKKLVSLAEATPQDKLDWRPAKGVRSGGEVYLHLAEDNFMIPAALGVKSPITPGKNFDTQTTDKAKIVSILKQSIATTRAAANTVKDSDLDKEVMLFGEKYSQRAALIIMLTHMSEHLGQEIAYARMNGIVPPWSRPSGS